MIVKKGGCKSGCNATEDEHMCECKRQERERDSSRDRDKTVDCINKISTSNNKLSYSGLVYILTKLGQMPFSLFISNSLN